MSATLRAGWPLAVLTLLAGILLSGGRHAHGQNEDVVRAFSSHGRVRVGDTVDITIEAGISLLPKDAVFTGAEVWPDAHWKRGGQSVSTAYLRAMRMTKSWTFRLVAQSPGLTRMRPVVYYRQEGAAADQPRDSIVAEYLRVSIVERPSRGIIPWMGVGFAALILAAAVGVLAMRNRRARTRSMTVLTPLEETRQMLTTAAANRREDRGPRYIEDLERIILGYLSRRLGHTVTSATASDVARLLSTTIRDPALTAQLTAHLKRCGELRFSGARVESNEMVDLEEQIRALLEQLDAAWVSSGPTHGPS